jgi:hypothetical protein
MKKYFFAIILSLVLFLPVFAAVAACSPGTVSNSICNPLGGPAGAIEDLPDLLISLLKYLAAFFGITTIIMIVYSGFRMVISMGNPQALTVAKSAFAWSLAGFVLAMFSFALVMAIAGFLGMQQIGQSQYLTNAEVVNPLDSGDMKGLIIDKILSGFLGLAGALAILMVIVSGIRYATAAGNDQQAASAKLSLQWAVIGLAVILFGYVIVRATQLFFTPS